MFNKIVGNNKNKEYLKTSIENKNILHSYMFVGKAGIGKKLFAREYAKRIMCLGEKNIDESNCDSCIKFDAKSNPDYLEITPDGKTIKIDQIRKMQEKIAEKPIISNKKVYVIDDADLMTEESQNCLLKTLEEPPEYAVIILVVSNENKILATIKSRCVKVKFEALSNEEIKKIMPNLSTDFIDVLGGSLQDIDNIEEKQEKYKELVKIVDSIENSSEAEIFNKCDLLYSAKDDIIRLLEYMNVILFNKKKMDCIKIVENTKRKILANNNYDMCIDYLLMNIWENNHR